MDPPAADAAHEDSPLVPPAPVAAVPGEQAATLVPLTSEVQARLDERARAFVDDLVAAAPRSPDFARLVSSIATMGEADLRSSATVASRLLERPVAARAGTAGSGGDATARVTAMLADLRRIVADLDPEAVEWEPARGVRRLLPGGGDPAARYFARYRAAQGRIDAVITGLLAGQDELRRDNAAIDTEKSAAQATLAKLSEYAGLAAALDAAVSRQVASFVTGGRPEAAEALRTEALVTVRQRRQDVLVHLAVVVQGYLALDVVRRNNIELVKAIERARTATVRALRAAVAAAGAMAEQSLVLDQIRALDTAAAAHLGAEPGGVEALRHAFGDLRATMDAIDGYREDAVTNMAATVESLERQVGR